jgi:hypothetical protein
VNGSENATLHGIYRSELRRALERIIRNPSCDSGEKPGCLLTAEGRLDDEKVEKWIRTTLLPCPPVAPHPRNW